MIFRSAYPKYSIGRLDFTARVLKPGAVGRGIRNFYGEIDSRKDATRLVARLGVPDLADKSADEQAAYIEKMVMSDPFFLMNYDVDKKTGKATLRANHSVGGAGVWLATDQQSIAETAVENKAISGRYKNFSDATLRTLIVESGGNVPTTASHDELVALAVEATDPNRPAAGEHAEVPVPQDGRRVNGPATRVATVSTERGE